MDDDQTKQMITVFDNFAKFIKQPENARMIPMKIQQKLNLLQQTLQDPNSYLDPVEYDQLQTDERNSLSQLQTHAKLQLYLNIIGMFMKQTKIVGKIEILGRSQIIWTEKQIELDLDLKMMKIQRKNQNDPPLIVDLKSYTLTFKGNHFGRYQYSLTTDDVKAQLKEIIIGGSNRDEMSEWIQYFKTCCQPDKLQTNEIFEVRQHLKTVAYSTIEKPKRKFSDGGVQENQSQIKLKPRTKTQTVATYSKKINFEKEIKQREEQTQKQIEIVTNPLPTIFEDLKTKLSYDYLINDENFKLVQFDQSARIMQSKTNDQNFRIYISLPKVPLQILIAALYDPYVQMKWNQEILKQTITLQATATLAQMEQTRKSLNLLYYPRVFKFLRYIHTEQDQFYVIDRSYETNVKNGKIDWSISGIFVREGQCKLMIVDTVTYNQGYITKGQDSQLTLNYLKQYAFLKQYLKEEKRKNSIKDNIEPIYVCEVMQQFSKFKLKTDPEQKQQQQQQQQQQILGDSKVRVSSDLTNLEQQKYSYSNDQFIDEDDDQLNNKDPFLYQDIRPELEKSIIVLEYADDVEMEQSLACVTETYDQYLRRLLMDVNRNKHWANQLHDFNLEYIPNIQNVQYQKTENGLHYFYKDEWVYDEKQGYLKFVNQSKLNAQRNVIKYILTKMGSNLLQGKSILNISLPVYIFETRTNLQRFADSFAFAPYFFEQVAQQPPLEQMKAVITFSLTTTIAYLTLEKPFNPILGETCQCWIKGCPMYLEQVSHHPPITSFIMYGNGYKLYGHMETYASIGANTVTGGNIGPITVQFNNGTKIEYSICKGYLSGITIGDRYFYTEGLNYYIDYENHYLGEVQMNPSQGLFGKKIPLDYFEGRIYKIDEVESSRCKRETYKRYQGLDKNQKQKYQILSKIEGNWQAYGNNAKIDGKVTFDIMKDFPYQVFGEEYPLASDSIYREDLIAWKMNNFDLAMEKKEKLEIIQRNDRKFRSQMNQQLH